MADRNVLVIAYYFPPMGLSGVQRTLKFVKYLPDYGWNPIVLTTSPGAYYAFDETLTKELHPDIKIYRTDKDFTKYARKNKNGVVKYPSKFTSNLKKVLLQSFLQPDSRILWKKHALRLAGEIYRKHNINVIYSTAPPFTDFLVASELNQKYGTPYVLDYRDPWVDNAYYFYATPFHKLYATKLESKVLTTAGKAFVITRHLKEMLIRRYKFLSHEDVTILPHGYDAEDFKPHQSVRPDSRKFTITHSGLFHDDMTPKYFLRALAAFLENNPSAAEEVVAKFVGVMSKSHIRLIKRYKLAGNVEMTGYVCHSAAVEHLMKSDVLWLMVRNNILTPGKLYEYIGSGRPMIVSAPDSNIRQLALETKSAIATGPEDIAAIQAAIKTYYDLWKLNTLPSTDMEFARRFDRKSLTGDLARELSLIAEI